MKLRSLAAVAALSTALFAGAALADGRIAAALDQPLAAKTKVVAGGAVFVCEGAECVSTQAPSRALTAVACKALAKEVGLRRRNQVAGRRRSDPLQRLGQGRLRRGLG